MLQDHTLSFELTNATSCRVATHHRHLPVHKYNIKIFAGFSHPCEYLRFLNKIQGFLSIICNADLAPTSLQPFGDYNLVDLIIFYEEDIPISTEFRLGFA